MANLAFELFLLSTNLSQFKSKVLITKLFIESINSLFEGHKFSWSVEDCNIAETKIQVCTRFKNYGYIHFNKQSAFTDETFSLLQNAVQLLAIQLEKIDQEELLKDQKEHLNILVQEKTKDLIESQNELIKQNNEIERQNKDLLNAIVKAEENENELNQAQELSHVGSWTYDTVSQKPIWSDEMFRICGLNKELGAPEYKEHKEFIHRDDWEIFDLAVKNAIEKGIPYNLELRICRADGQIKTVITICKPIINPINGKVIELKGTSQDITEKKLIENTQSFLLKYDYLNTNQNFFEYLARFLSETLNMDYICIDTLHGDLLSAKTLAIYFDGKFDKNVEYTLKDTPCGDVVGNNICCFTHGVRHLFPDDIVLQEMVAESYIGTTLWGTDTKPIGLIATIGRKSISNTSTAEKILQIVGLKAASEIERLRSLQELTESENRLKLATSSGKLGVWDWNVKENVMIWDDRMFELYGVTKDTFPNNNDAWTNGLHPEDKQGAVDECNLALNGEKEFNTTFRVVHPDGTILHLKGDGLVIRDAENKPVRMIGINKDITENKQAEIKLQQSEATIRNKLKAITEPDGDMATLELSDIIDTQVLQSLLEDFHKLTGILGAILDVSGKVLVAVGWQDICTKFHRCHPDTLKNCIESDTILTHGVPAGTSKAYRCKNNMYDIVTPIMLGNRHVGNVFIGQFFHQDEKPDVELFRKQARQYGFDETEYLAALDRVPRFSQQTIDAGIQFYAKLANIISTLSFSTIQQSRMLAERKQAEIELIIAKQKAEESEESFRRAVVAAPFPIMIHAEDGEVVTINQAWTDLTGYSHKDIPTIPDWTERAYRHRSTIVKEYIDQLYSLNRKAEEGEYEILTSKGNKIIWDFSSAPIGKISDGRRLVISMARDVTERKLAESELIAAKEKAEESEKKFKVLYENAPLSYQSLDTNARLIDVNPAWLQTLGYKREEVIGRLFGDFMTQESAELIKERFPAFVEQGEIHNYEFEMIRKDGTRFLVSYDGKIGYDELGHFNKTHCIFTDITDRRLFETELLKAKEKAEKNEKELKKAQEIAHIGSWYLDVATNEVVWTEELYKMYGFDPTLPVPPYTEHMKLFTPESWEILSTSLAKTSEKGIPYELELKTLRKDGSNGWLWAHGESVRDAEGTIIGLWGAAQDITDRKQAEEKILDQLSELRRWNEALLDREERVMELKREVNELLVEEGKSARYASAVDTSLDTE